MMCGWKKLEMLDFQVNPGQNYKQNSLPSELTSSWSQTERKKITFTGHNVLG